MIQRELPIWKTRCLFTYSQVTEFRNREYAKSGAVLVRQLSAALEEYAEFEDVESLSEANRVVFELAVLNPIWQDFSVQVFMACFPMLHRDHGINPQRLLSNFKATLEKMAEVAA